MAASTLLSRRGFLAASSATALTLGSGAPAKPILHAVRPLVAKGPSQAAWEALAAKLKGPVVRPGHPDYFKLALPDNLRYARTLPAGIARCLVGEDVATAIGWSRENNIPLITRSGGHSYAGYSTTTGLMIDMTLLNQIGFDPASSTVTIAGGALNEQIYAKLASVGMTITHGRCPSVGAAAFLLGGGIGFNMREDGLACVQVVATDIVTPNGTLLQLKAGESDPERREFFWACQGGGGGNFGISTSFTMKAFPVPKDDIVVFNLIWSKKPQEVAAALMKALEGAPATLGSRVSLGAVTPAQRRAGLDVKVNLLGQFKGPLDVFMDILKPVYAIAEPDDDVSKTEVLPYWQGQDFLSEPAKPTYYQERSAFMNEVLSPRALQTGFDHLRQWPGTGGYCDLRFFQTGKAVNAVGASDTAFVHRSSEWLMVVGLYWSEEDNRDPRRMAANHAWQNAFYLSMLPFARGGAYQNFPDPSLTDWRRSYYGQNLDRLAAVKNTLDPTRVFNFPQAI